ncbi:unnamed protein product [Haemonchus placei]|uniref:Retrovirus-related Pol polyprotein from type-1 retrotransposable element R1 n=1 Tax=Haemonchus placei TaxID=6290 RepID=A0A0N4WLJ5_HAEPC|nr:unnamed protein product [Haemonchus placei]
MQTTGGPTNTLCIKNVNVNELAETMERRRIDFFAVRETTHRAKELVTDAKAIPYETVCTIKIAPLKSKVVERCGLPRIKWWRLKEKEEDIVYRTRIPAVTIVDDTWKGAANTIARDARSELGIIKPGRRKVDEQTWLWTDIMPEINGSQENIGAMAKVLRNIPPSLALRQVRPRSGDNREGHGYGYKEDETGQNNSS